MTEVELRGYPPEWGRDPLDVDEVVVRADGRCVFRLEVTDSDRVWMAAYWPEGGRRVSWHVAVIDGKLAVRVQDDDRTTEEKAGDTHPPAGGEWGTSCVIG